MKFHSKTKHATKLGYRTPDFFKARVATGRKILKRTYGNKRKIS